MTDPGLQIRGDGHLDPEIRGDGLKKNFSQFGLKIGRGP